MSALRPASPDDLSVELFAPCEGCSVTKDHRINVRAPFGRIGVQTLPVVHAVIALPIVVWGPPHAHASLRVRFERPGEPADAEVCPPIELSFDASGICGVAATLERVLLRREGVHALSILAGDRVLVRRRILVRRVPSWEWTQGDAPSGA